MSQQTSKEMKINRIFHASVSADGSEEKRKKTQLRQLVMINKNYTKSTHCCAFKTSTRSLSCHPRVSRIRIVNSEKNWKDLIWKKEKRKSQPRMGEEWKNYKTHWTVQNVKKKRAEKLKWKEKSGESLRTWVCPRMGWKLWEIFSVCCCFFFASSNHHPLVARSPHSPATELWINIEYNIQTCCLLPPKQ